MRVIVIFEFNGLDPNSEKAEQIIHEIGKSCETMRIGFDADTCFIDDVESD
jgi:hypothetical protein